eukprot:COSAG01_NODE_4408_length_5059_cov_2.693565_4_plen_181_part_00
MQARRILCRRPGSFTAVTTTRQTACRARTSCCRARSPTSPYQKRSRSSINPAFALWRSTHGHGLFALAAAAEIWLPCVLTEIYLCHACPYHENPVDMAWAHRRVATPLLNRGGRWVAARRLGCQVHPCLQQAGRWPEPAHPHTGPQSGLRTVDRWEALCPSGRLAGWRWLAGCMYADFLG